MSIKSLTRALTLSGAFTIAATALPALVMSSAARADSISPAAYSNTLGIGGSATITKTVTITKGSPTSALVDVLFLTDTTGSMSSAISGVRTQFSSIVTDLAGLG